MIATDKMKESERTSLRVSQRTKAAVKDYLSQLIGVRKDPGLSQDDAVAELLKHGVAALEREKGNGNSKN